MLVNCTFKKICFISGEKFIGIKLWKYFHFPFNVYRICGGSFFMFFVAAAFAFGFAIIFLTSFILLNISCFPFYTIVCVVNSLVQYLCTHFFVVFFLMLKSWSISGVREIYIFELMFLSTFGIALQKMLPQFILQKLVKLDFESKFLWF